MNEHERLALRLCAVVEERRREAGLTQADLAKASGLSRIYIAQLERGRRHPSLITVSRLAAGLGVDIIDLIADASGAGQLPDEVLRWRKMHARLDRPRGDEFEFGALRPR